MEIPHSEILSIAMAVLNYGIENTTLKGTAMAVAMFDFWFLFAVVWNKINGCAAILFFGLILIVHPFRESNPGIFLIVHLLGYVIGYLVYTYHTKNK